MAISFDSIGQECVTVLSGNASAGTLCKFTSNNFVAPCADGNAFHGMILKQSGGYATLAVRGFITVAYSGSAPSVGYCCLAAAGPDKVKKLDGAKQYLVVNVDPAASTVTFLL